MMYMSCACRAVTNETRLLALPPSSSIAQTLYGRGTTVYRRHRRWRRGKIRHLTQFTVHPHIFTVHTESQTAELAHQHSKQ